jgi:hypothetical protein
MNLKILLLLAALVLPLCLSHPALSGQGCGTNWLGSDSNDPDFYVSKNQNLGADSGMAEPTSASVPAAGVQSIKIGQSYNTDTSSSNNVKLSLISSLTPDKTSPQASGTAIKWTAGATDQSGLLYMFLLKGPSTNGQLIERTNWTSNNVWVWNTTNADIGDNQVEVRARDGKHAGPEGFDDSKDSSFTVSAAGTVNAASSIDPNPHPPSRTADLLSKGPKTPPDERPRPSTLGNPNGPNMDMPDPTPKSLNSASSSDDTGNAGAANTSTAIATAAPEQETVDIGGKWSFQLDRGRESMDLILIQTKESIMGSGTLGSDKIPLIASGTIDNDSLSLDVKTVVGQFVNQIDKQYKLDMTLVDGTMSGSYESFSDENSTGKGVAVATQPGK